MEKPSGLSTRCIHGGELEDAHGSPCTPLYASTTFKFARTAALLDVIEERKPGSLYTRYGLNPTLLSLEDKLAGLEGAEAAWAFSSGMAAISATFIAHGRRGIVCVGDAYGGTLELLGSQLPQLGYPTHFLPDADPQRLAEVLRQGVGLVFFETPSNPLLDILDIRAIAEVAHAHGALLAIDNTFATPVNQQPLALGADLVMHSCTKYLGGHSDLTAGAVMGSRDLLQPLRNWRKNLGSTIAPDTAHLLARSLRTLVVRVRQHNANAQAVAEALLQHPKVARVLYPGLPGFPGHALAQQQMSGFGGMLGLEIKGSGEDAARVVDRLQLIALAPSLGGVESLVTQPCTTSHHDLTPEERAQRGISDALLRLSIGLEDADDLIADLNQALG